MTSNKGCCDKCTTWTENMYHKNPCPCHTKESDWEKELSTYWRHDSSIGGYLQLKDFISSLLTKQKASILKEVREVIEGMKRERGSDPLSWYNYALTDLLTKLEELN